MTSATVWAVVGVSWLAFGCVWLVAARGASRPVKREPFTADLEHRAFLVVGYLLLFASPFSGVPILDARFDPDAFAWLAFGETVFVAGFTLVVWARVTLGKEWSSRVTIKEGHQLVERGPYARIRHPIYTALIVMYAGSAIAVGELRALVGLALVALSFVRKLAVEERFLAGEFGPAWTAYVGRTKRLVPGVW
ncbi:MAG: methyltransferase family protein [Thermoplasmatota archaeon]